MDKKNCFGCRNDFYNGKNGMGVKECWSFKSAKLEWRIPVGMQEPPPYKNKKAKRVPNCWHGEGPYRTLYIKKEAITKDGYWR